MKKIIVACLVTFVLTSLFVCKSVKPKENVLGLNKGKVTVTYEGKVIGIFERDQFVRICFAHIELEKINNAEEEGRIYVTGDDEGNMILVWSDENEDVIKILRFKI